MHIEHTSNTAYTTIKRNTTPSRHTDRTKEIKGTERHNYGDRNVRKNSTTVHRRGKEAMGILK